MHAFFCCKKLIVRIIHLKVRNFHISHILLNSISKYHFRCFFSIFQWKQSVVNVCISVPGHLNIDCSQQPFYLPGREFMTIGCGQLGSGWLGAKTIGWEDNYQFLIEFCASASWPLDEYKNDHECNTISSGMHR